MQDSGYGYPPVEDRSQGLPLLLCALAATTQNVPPEPIDALSEDAQLIDISREQHGIGSSQWPPSEAMHRLD